MKYTLYYVHAKLKAVKGKRLQGNTGVVHFSIVRWNLLKRNIKLQGEKKTADWGIDFCIEQSKNKIRKGPCYICGVNFVINYFIRDQFTFLAKVNICVKRFSV